MHQTINEPDHMPDYANEAALIDALRQHDQAALALLFEQNADRLYRLAVGILHDEQMADGVVQDTFISLIEHIDTFEGRSTLATWLYRVAYNHALGRLRRQKPRLELDDLDEGYPLPENLVRWDDLPDDALEQDEIQAQLAAAVETLKPGLKAVFILRDVEGLSTEETAQALEISAGAVKVRLHRARLLLREQLAAYFEET